MSKNQNNTNISITEEYLQDYELYRKKYGDKTFILIQVGSFFEAYSTNSRGPNLQVMSSVLNIYCTRKDKTISEINEKNPYMMGFPMVATNKFIQMLVSNGYTVIMKEQVTQPPNPVRKITQIYSPGTYIDNIEKSDANNIICIYFEEEKQRNGSSLLCAGLSCIDISTGKCIVHKVLSTETDRRLAIDETMHFINTLNPSEIIIYFQQKITKNADILEADTGYSKDKIISYLNLDNWNYIFNSDIPKKYNEIRFQNEFFGKIYKDTGILQPIEYIELDELDYEYTRLSFILLLNFAIDHNEYLVHDIEKPQHFTDVNRLKLHNNAIYQLNIIHDNNINKKHYGYGSLFDVVNNTSTAMGYRLLKDRLTSPLKSSDALNKIYSDTEIFIKDNLYLDINENLISITDIERLNIKMLMKKLQPCDFVLLIDSLGEALNMSHKLKNKGTVDIIPDNDTLTQIQEMIKYSNKTFTLSEMKKYTVNNISDSFFMKGIYPDIDKLNNSIKSDLELMNELSIVLSEYITDSRNSKNQKSKICVKRNELDGYYLNLSKPRAEILKTNLANIESITVRNTEIKTDRLKFNMHNKNNTKIVLLNNNNNNNNSNNLDYENTEIDTDDIHNTMIALITTYFYKEMDYIYATYSKYIKRITYFVAYCDYIKSNAKTAQLYNYTQPIIKYNIKNSYVKATNMRHPIIERLIDYEYIPHNVDLGNELKGMLVYGLNSSGKSSYMKAIGLCIIMAQAGLYIPAESFIYSPYDMLFTRITGDDNLFKGLSSFTVEMIELKAIMKRANSKTLIIGDEICRGTEHISANAIVASAIIKLNEAQSSFIFATHLHEIAKMKRITDLQNVKSYYISVELDAKSNRLIYDRKMKEGSGENIYGITVAKYIIADNDFTKLATEIKNDMLNEYSGLTSGKTSRYNTDLLIDECTLCHAKNKKSHISPLETHHIFFQKDCTNGFLNAKPHIHKNNLSNLVVLCSECHDKLHSGDFTIDGYVMTSRGKSLKVNKDNNTLLL